MLLRIENNRSYIQFFLLSVLASVSVIPLFFSVSVEAIRWLGIYHLRKPSEYQRDSTALPFSAKECQIARTHLGFRPRQYKFCTHPKMGFAMLPILRAARAVGYHCPDTFSDRRWNCSSVEMLPRVSPELKLGTREQAIVHAYASAALIFEIGRYCALNKIRFCSCGSIGATQISTGQGDHQMSRNPIFNRMLPSKRTKRQINKQQFTLLKEAIEFTGNDAKINSQTQNMHAWSGCPDNVEVARSYVAAFLGFNERRLLMMNYQGTEHTPQVSNYDQLPLEFYEQPDALTSNRLSINKDSSIQRSAGSKDASHASITDRTYQRSKRMAKKHRNKSPIIRLTNHHNYMAGVWLMISLQKHSCKCHGVSGSCAQKICFRQLQRIDTPVIKVAMKKHYLQAKRVSKIMQGQLLANVFKETGYIEDYVKLNDLVFNKHSPDYCEIDPQRGSMGTHGRLCSLNSTGDDSCMNMCCGRQHKSVTKRIFEKCNCVMQSNFKVTCQACVREETENICL